MRLYHEAPRAPPLHGASGRRAADDPVRPVGRRRRTAQSAGPDGHPETLGAVRAVTDPDNVEAEFGIIVRSDLKGSGLGALLMDKLLRALREHGTRRVVATVLTENDRMRGLARHFGFVEGANAPEGVRAIALDLAPAAGAPP